MLQILSVRYRNFRALRDVTIPLRRNTILVGPNNVGKTSVLEGLEHALGLGRRAYAFDDRDVSEGVDPRVGFEVRLTLGPRDGDHFGADEVALFGMHVDVVDGKHRLFVVVAGRLDDEEGIFRTRLRFAMSDEKDHGSVSAVEREALGILLLPAIREARHEFGERGGLWPRLGADSEISEVTRADLDQMGLEVGERVVKAILGDAEATQVSESMTGLMSSVLYADEATPTIAYSVTSGDLAQALRDVEVRVTIPSHSQGRRVGDLSVGTQSVAMFGLFGAYAQAAEARLVMVGIEEPEAHLHPHATRAIVQHLGQLGFQTVVTTHSTAVTDAADPRSIVRLRRRGLETTAHSIGPAVLSDSEARAIQRMVADVGSDFLFARAVLLSEGSSERLALPRFAAGLGHDFDILGITVVPVYGNSFRAFARLLGRDGLDIPFARLSDLDAAVRTMKGAVVDGTLPDGTEQLAPDVARATALPLGVFWWSAGDFEDCLLAAGAGSLYVDAIAEAYGDRHLEGFATASGRQLPADPASDHAFLKAVLRSKVSKPLLAQRVAELFIERGIALPAEVREVVEYVAELARNEARMATIATAELDAPGSGAGDAVPTHDDRLPPTA
jgi:putative ATP-dependent endonuclease of the OLD family